VVRHRRRGGGELLHVRLPELEDRGRRSQEEVDTFWSKLSEGGEEGPCGWLKDRYGVSWQIVPTALPRLLGDPDREKSQRVMEAMLQMKKIEIEPLERAAAQA
jgi:predicted 3-demethylubiquinone-9 3-methyltransferase (glyoxalase superfamily)